jgi:hypothetical protein
LPVQIKRVRLRPENGTGPLDPAKQGTGEPGAHVAQRMGPKASDVPSASLSSSDIVVEVQGVICIYNPPEKDEAEAEAAGGTPGDAAAGTPPADATTLPDGTAPATPPDGTTPPPPADNTAPGTTPADGTPPATPPAGPGNPTPPPNG